MFADHMKSHPHLYKIYILGVGQIHGTVKSDVESQISMNFHHHSPAWNRKSIPSTMIYGDIRWRPCDSPPKWIQMDPNGDQWTQNGAKKETANLSTRSEAPIIPISRDWIELGACNSLCCLCCVTVRRCDLSPIGHGSRGGFKNGTTRLAAFSIKPSSVCKALNSSGKKKSIKPSHIEVNHVDG